MMGIYPLERCEIPDKRESLLERERLGGVRLSPKTLRCYGAHYTRSAVLEQDPVDPAPPLLDIMTN